MEFFRTGDGHTHGPRVAAVLFLVGLGLAFAGPDRPLQLVAKFVFFIGWLMAFCGKSPVAGWRLSRHPVAVIGMVLLVVGLVAEVYALWAMMVTG